MYSMSKSFRLGRCESCTACASRSDWAGGRLNALCDEVGVCHVSMSEFSGWVGGRLNARCNSVQPGEIVQIWQVENCPLCTAGSSIVDLIIGEEVSASLD